MSEMERIQILLKEKADLKSQVNINSFDGSIEVKAVDDEKYIYVRKKVGGKNRSTYVGKFSEELYALAVHQSQHIRMIRKQLRRIEKELAELGHQESTLSPRVWLNIDYARANVKSLIYDQAVLEGVSTTFPQTEAILENGEVNGVLVTDVLKILNLKRAWEFIVDPDVVSSSCNFHLLSYIADIVNDGFYRHGGMVRSVPVCSRGTSYVPPLPMEADVKERITEIVGNETPSIDVAIELALYAMKTQIFLDGNKRAAIIFANHYAIQHGLGLLVVPEKAVDEFRNLLVAYYEGKNNSVRVFLKEKCWRQF